MTLNCHNHFSLYISILKSNEVKKLENINFHIPFRARGFKPDFTCKGRI